MMSSNSVQRRYTPPTCTLEIVSQTSPLFRALNRSILKQFNFSLNFDDPRLPEEKRITIHGNQTQLETLYQAVKAYIQDFLVQKPENFPGWNLLTSEISQSTPEEQEISNSPGQTFPSEEPKISETEPSPVTPENYQPTSTPDTTNLPPHNLNLEKANSNINLQPRNILSHDLFLGSLATPESGPAINLSLLQLFDLATALEEYKIEQKGLPKPRPTTGRKLPPYWVISAAMVTVTVGVTAGIVRMLDQGKRTPEATPAVINPTSNQNQTNLNVVQPQVAAIPSPLPAPTPGVVTPPGTSPQTLPSPPGLLGNQTPNPTATPPLGTPGQVPPANTLTSPMGTVGVPTTPPGGLPPGTYRIGSPATGLPGAPPVGNTTGGSSISIPVNNSPTPTTTRKPPVNPTPIAQAKPQNRSAQQSTPASPTSVQMFPRETLPPPSPTLLNFVAKPLATTPLPSTEQNLPNQAKPTPAATSKPKPKDNSQLAGLGHQSGNSTSEPLSSNTLRGSQNSQATEVVDKKNSPIAVSETSAAPTVAALRPDSTPKNNSTANASNSNSLFDQIPQVAEARQFFQQRWQAPSSLTQDQIEYTLSLNADGTIKQVTPRGQVAQIYLDRTQMPLTGEPFVSPVEGGRTPEILLILHKNGKVETRLQTLN